MHLHPETIKQCKDYETKNVPPADRHEKAMNMARKSATNRLHSDTDDEQPTTFPMTIDRNEMMARAQNDVGETLIEIVLTIVSVGLTIAALLSSLATVGNASNAQRRSVQTDVVMRNYAEATKAATQTCVVGGTYTVVYPAPLPTGFAISGAGSACPTQATVAQLLTLTVTGPFGPPTTMQIKVNTP